MRKRVLTACLTAAWLASAILAASCDSRSPSGPSGELTETLVRLAAGVPPERVAARHGGQVVRPLEAERVWLLLVPASDLAGLAADPEVVAVAPNAVTEAPEAEGRSSMAFADPALGQADYADQDALARIRAQEAWARTTGAGVIVAVLDTGVDAGHPFLAGRVLDGVDLVDGDDRPEDEGDGIDSDGDGLTDEAAGHGTFVAGLVLAVAPDARILPVRVLDSDGVGRAEAVASGVEIARRRGARVINLSLGMEVESDVIEDLAAELADQGILLVASAGNLGSDERRYPAGSGEVVGVAAADAADRRADFSNYGSWVGVAAPGVGLVSAFRGDLLATWSGTSFAAALVSGEAALLVALRPAARIDDVVDAIERSAVETDGAFGGAGRIDVAAAADELIERAD